MDKRQYEDKALTVRKNTNPRKLRDQAKDKGQHGSEGKNDYAVQHNEGSRGK